MQNAFFFFYLHMFNDKKLNQSISTGPAHSMGNIGGRLGRHLLEGTLQALPKKYANKTQTRIKLDKLHFWVVSFANVQKMK